MVQTGLPRGTWEQGRSLREQHTVSPHGAAPSEVDQWAGTSGISSRRAALLQHCPALRSPCQNHPQLKCQEERNFTARGQPPSLSSHCQMCRRNVKEQKKNPLRVKEIVLLESFRSKLQKPAHSYISRDADSKSVHGCVDAESWWRGRWFWVNRRHLLDSSKSKLGTLLAVSANTTSRL